MLPICVQPIRWLFNSSMPALLTRLQLRPMVFNGAYSSMAGKPCIIVEWKYAGGDYVKDASGKRIGMVIFLDE